VASTAFSCNNLMMVICDKSHVTAKYCEMVRVGSSLLSTTSRLYDGIEETIFIGLLTIFLQTHFNG
jgi:tetrahydromethanopterin S-methyltransferase subunit F